MTLPQTNARLLTVTARAGAEDYGDPAEAGEEKFAGVAGAYFQEKRRRNLGPNGVSIVVERSLTLRSSAPAVDFEEGDVVELERRLAGAWSPITATIADVETAETPGIPGETILTFVPG